MNQLVGASKSIPDLVSRWTRMLTLIQSRSFCESLQVVNLMRKDDTDFLSFFNKEGKAERIEGDRTEIYCGPVFTGDLERRYLDYLEKLDWDSLQKHMVDYPRVRSENEVRVIFDKWAAHSGRKYPSPELKEMRFPEFKQTVDSNDRTNSRGYAHSLRERPDVSFYPVSFFSPSPHDYLVRGFGVCYESFTRPDFCELSGNCDDDYYLKLIKRSKRPRICEHIMCR